MCLNVIVLELFVIVRIGVDGRTMTGREPIDPSVDDEMASRP